MLPLNWTTFWIAVKEIAPWVSLLCGLYALYQASKQMKEARLQTEKLHQVSRSLSTQYLGEFPNYLQRVAELIKSAESDLKVMCAIPAHGSFTESQRSTEVRHAIELASHRMAVEFTFNNEERRRASFRLQYPQAVENWGDYIKNPANVDRVMNFLKHTYPDTDINSLTGPSLQDLVEEEDQKAIKNALALVKRRETRNLMPIYFWIADDSRAIFAIASNTPVSSSKGFFTTDSGIISALQQLKIGYDQDK